MYVGVHIIIPQNLCYAALLKDMLKKISLFLNLVVTNLQYNLGGGGGGGGGLGEICLYIQVSDIHTVGWNRVLGIEGLYSLPTIKGDCPVCAVDVYRGAHNYSSKLRYYMLCCTAQRYAQKKTTYF